MLKLLMKMNKSWLLPLLSGFLIGTSYIPFPPWASLFCFVPLWLFWSRQTSFKTVILGGVVTAFVFTVIGFNWVAYLLHEFAHLNWFLAVIGMMLFALIAHLFVPLAGALWFLGRRQFRWSGLMSLWMMALLTTLVEFYSTTLFDWNFGYSWFGAGLPVYQWAEVIGFKGLSAATLLANLPMLIAWKKRKEKTGLLIFSVVVSLFILLNAGGAWLKYRLPEPDASLNALLVQANIGNYEKQAAVHGSTFRDSVISRYQDETVKGILSHPGIHIDFALWPETAFPAGLGEDYKHQRYSIRLKRFLQSRQLPLITGAFSQEKSSHRITNSLFVLDKNGDVIPPYYSKTILLAFGEYIPGETLFPQIREWLPQTGNFARGGGPTILTGLNDYKMGPQICYESLFPEFSRELAELGAQFIVNVTNDSWYGTWQEPYQHMYMTLARGIEFRRPVLRVTNTGISTVALASGEVLEQSPFNQAWSGLYKVPYIKNPHPTFYQTWFELIPFLLWLGLIISLGAGIFVRQSQTASGSGRR